eukprot:g1098.t1
MTSVATDAGDEGATASSGTEFSGAVDITPSGDGGVLKIVTKHAKHGDSGEGETATALVQKGEMVYLHYVGILDRNGEEFDQSRQVGSAYSTPFSFIAGNGQVVKGFDLAVLSMEVGERAKFVMKAAYAYGESGCKGSGMAPDILPGDDLIFDIEIVSSGAPDESKADQKARLDRLRLDEIKAERERKKVLGEELREKREADKRAAAEAQKKRKEKKGGKGKAAAGSAALDSKAVKKMKPSDLKKHLKAAGLSIQGNKKVLIARLLETL